MPDSPCLLALEDVAKSFAAPEPGGAPVAVLAGVTLDLHAGETLAVTGASGSGKSTLLHLMAGLERPSGGRVLLDARDLALLDDAASAALRARRIGLVFQAHHLLPQCSVWENVLAPTLALRPGERAGATATARRLLERVGLGARLAHRPGQLSGGERQRVAVARALVNGPALLCADEPTGSLDRRAADALAALLLELNREERVALVVATHAPELAARMARRAEIVDGRVVTVS
ncbi:MAG: ATP-binding cassette domain-containing protein [Planctomycetes bacterium]|nr:ATP-binding cassette domain-containing protein [Planctomycetota bacterium]